VEIIISSIIKSTIFHNWGDEMKFVFLLIIFAFMIPLGNAQNLLKERIWKIPPRKKSIYLDQGVFHGPVSTSKSRLEKVRHSFTKKNGYERVVFDFNTNEIPKIYGHLSSNDGKLYFDLFNTTINSKIGSFGTSKFVKDLNFYPITEDTLSVEVKLKQKANVDIFYLENPGRMVVDIKE